MAKKQAGAKKPEASTPKTQAVGATPAPTANDAPRPKQVEQPQPLSLSLIFMAILFPFVSLISSNEAPPRPFAILKPTSTESSPKASLGGVQQPAFIDSRVLLVTAHPDDEILFAPTVLSMLSEERREYTTLWAVTLTTGDFVANRSVEAMKAQADARRVEWDASWEVLGLHKDRRWLLDVPNLKDDPEATWDAQTISEHVIPFVLENEINTIITFDEHGVTKHPNHCAVKAGMVHLINSLSETEPTKSKIQLYTLKTIPATANYGPLSPVLEHLRLGFSVLYRELRLEYGSDETKQRLLAEKRSIFFISGWRRYYQTWKALLKHWSQMSPVTIVIGIIGKYLWVNEWVQVAL